MISLLSHAQAYHLKPAAVVTGLVAITYVVLLLPACIAGSHDIVELSVSSTDAPYVYLQFVQEMGADPRISLYGDFLPVVLAVATAPLRGLAAILHFEISQEFYILSARLSQLGCGVLALFGLYRLTARLSSPWMGCAAVTIAVTMLEFIENTAILHPDIWQWMAELFSLGALVNAHCRYRANRRVPASSIFIAAVWAGAATASKFNGLFLAPAVAVALFSPLVLQERGEPIATAFSAIIRGAALFIAVFVGATIAFWPFIMRAPLQLIAYIVGFETSFQSIGFWQGIELLTWEKLTNLVSSTMMGPFVPAIYVLVSGITFLRWLRRRGAPYDPLNILHAFIIFSLVHYLFFFRDTFNVHHSERYIIMAVTVMLTVVLVIAHRRLREGSWVVGACMLALVFAWQGAQAAGLAGVSGLSPLYKVMHKNAFLRFGSVDIPEPLAAKLRAAYVYDDQAQAYILRSDLTPAEQAEATAIRRTREGAATLLNPNYAAIPFIFRLWRVEDWAGFRIRSWMMANIPQGKSILIEYYMNLEDAQICGCDPDYLGDRRILQNRQLIYITDDYVRDFHPDYMLTRRETVEIHLLQAFPEYELAATVEGTPTNLLDDAEAAPADNKHPPSVVFVLRRTSLN
jgi:hypothetical protein